MSKEKRLIFCYYCGNLIKEYDDEKTKICPYCGIELHYTDKKNKRTKAHKTLNSEVLDFYSYSNNP